MVTLSIREETSGKTVILAAVHTLHHFHFPRKTVKDLQTTTNNCIDFSL